jgi:DNA-directed RNA polymerase specialized sigma24 family protein
MPAGVEPEGLVRDNIDWMLKLVERLLRDRSLAEDAEQEAFIQAFRGLKDFEGRSTLETWPRRALTLLLLHSPSTFHLHSRTWLDASIDQSCLN